MIDLPRFEPTKAQQEHVEHHRQTAAVVRRLWAAASPHTRRDSGFLAALTRATWVGSHHETDSARLTRNRYWAEWLELDTSNDDQLLSEALLRRLPGLSRRGAEAAVRAHTGMTLYYASVRPGTISFIHRHSTQVSRAIAEVTRTAVDPAVKAKKAAQMLADLPEIRMPAGGWISCFSGLTPLCACLDPQRRFPVMNKRTAALLRVLDGSQDAAGAAILVDLVGQYNIRDSFELDVYAFTHSKRISRVAKRARQKPSIRALSAGKLRSLGQKSEEVGVAQLARRRLLIRRLHNELTNRFKKAVSWQHNLRQSAIDILVDRWKGGRWLLIEAKTATSGAAGRAQLRQAIGQLFDYRRIQFPKHWRQVDLALLTPIQPEKDILELLKSLDIEALWFEGKNLEGTIKLLR